MTHSLLFWAGFFARVFKGGFTQKTHRVFWVHARVSEPCKVHTQPDTCSDCKATKTALVYRVAHLSTFQLLLVLNAPIHRGIERLC